MSATDTKGRRDEPTTDRGRAIVAWLDSKGITLQAAAKRSGLSYGTIRRLIHAPSPDNVSVGTVVSFCTELGAPWKLVAPQLRRLLDREPLSA